MKIACLNFLGGSLKRLHVINANRNEWASKISNLKSGLTLKGSEKAYGPCQVPPAKAYKGSSRYHRE